MPRPSLPRSARRRGPLVLLLVVLAGCTDFGDPVVRPAPPVASVALVSPGAGNLELEAGIGIDFVAQVRDATGAVIPGAAVEWSSSAATVVRVDATGALTARASGLAPGTAEVRAASGGVQSAAVTVTVVPATRIPARIAITPSTTQHLTVGEEVVFQAEVRDAQDSVIAGAAVVWSSSLPNVARIDALGALTALAEGETDIQATIDTLSSPAVHVLVHPRTLSLATDVQPIFDAHCVGCHPANAGLDLRAGRSFDSLVDRPSTERPSLVRVRPGDPAASYLYIKLVGPCPGPDCSGSRMPQGGALSAVEIATVRSWILGGALP
jgi:hypothetical protein